MNGGGSRLTRGKRERERERERGGRRERERERERREERERERERERTASVLHLLWQKNPFLLVSICVTHPLI